VYTREEVLNDWDPWLHMVAPLLDSVGIDTSWHDPDNVIAVVWMADDGSNQWEPGQMGSMAFGRGHGRFQTTSNYRSEVLGPGVSIHELAHAGPGFTDCHGGHYGDAYNPMSAAGGYFNYWRTPYFSAPDAAQWYPVTLIQNAGQAGLRTMRPFDAFAFGNPLQPTELLYIQCIANWGGWLGLINGTGQSATRLLAWHQGDFDEGADWVIHTLLFAADGDPVDQSISSDGFAYSSLDSVPFYQWAQGGDSTADRRVWVTVNGIVNYADSTTVTVHYEPLFPYLDLISDSVFSLSVGTSWYPSFTVHNRGGSCGPIQIRVTSNIPDLLPDFIVEPSDSILSEEEAVLTSEQPVYIPNNPALWGSIATLTLHFPNGDHNAILHMSMLSDTLSVERRFACPVVMQADTLSNRLLIGSHDTLFCFDSEDQLLWSEIPWSGHPITQIAVGDVRNGNAGQEVAVVADSQRLYLYSNTGSLFANWPLEVGAISTPACMIADGYVWYVDDRILRGYDCILNMPPYYEGDPRSEVRFPTEIHPDGWCLLGNPAMGDTVTGLAFAYTTGLATHHDGKFFIMDTGGRVVYPLSTILNDANHGYGVPIAYDLIAADGCYEVHFDYFDNDFQGGAITCVYSQALDSIGLGITTFGLKGVVPLAHGATLGDPSNWTARSMFCYHDNDSVCTRIVIGNANNPLGVGRHVAFLLSTAFDAVAGDYVFAARCNQVFLFSPSGTPANSNRGLLFSLTGADTVAGAPLVLTRPNGEAILFTPKSNGSSWDFDQRVLPGHAGADWIGLYGDPSNTGRHNFLGAANQDTISGPEGVTSTIYPISPGVVRLSASVSGHSDWHITQYQVHQGTSYAGPFSVDYYSCQGCWQFSQQYNADSLGVRSYFYTTVRYDTLQDGRSLWGEHELPPPQW
jgi:hypothetical protein